MSSQGKENTDTTGASVPAEPTLYQKGEKLAEEISEATKKGYNDASEFIAGMYEGDISAEEAAKESEMRQGGKRFADEVKIAAKAGEEYIAKTADSISKAWSGNNSKCKNPECKCENCECSEGTCNCGKEKSAADKK